MLLTLTFFRISQGGKKGYNLTMKMLQDDCIIIHYQLRSPEHVMYCNVTLDFCSRSHPLLLSDHHHHSCSQYFSSCTSCPSSLFYNLLSLKTFAHHYFIHLTTSTLQPLSLVYLLLRLIEKYVN